MFDLKLISNDEPFKIPQVRYADGSVGPVYVYERSVLLDKDGFIWSLTVDAFEYQLYYNNRSKGRIIRAMTDFVLPAGITAATFAALKKDSSANLMPRSYGDVNSMMEPITARAQSLVDKYVIHNAEPGALFYGNLFGNPYIVAPAPIQIALTAEEKKKFSWHDF